MKLKNKIQSIIDAIKHSDINHIEISSFWGAQKIKLTKDLPKGKLDVSYDNIKESSILNIDKKESTEIDDNKIVTPDVSPADDEENLELQLFKSPLVGTYYQSSKPGEPPFIEQNQKIAKGQVLCVIEAMKIFNEIESEKSGQIIEILVKDGDPIEYDQPLFTILED